MINMKICLIAEGSYPYVTGGVSSWIQMLINSMPENEFVIYAIGAEEKDRGTYKYVLPPNVTEIKEMFLDSTLKENGEWGKKFKMSSEEKHAFKALISGEDLDWRHLFQFIMSSKDKSVSDFLMSKECFDIISEVGEVSYPYIVFNEYFWTIRSIILTLFAVIRSELPEADIYHSVCTGYAGAAASAASSITGKPFVLTEHGIYTREREEEIIKSDWVKGYLKDIWIKYFYSISKCAYSFADVVISLYDGNRKIQIELGCDEKKAMVIPNGINCDSFRNLDTVKDGADAGGFNIGAVIRLVPIKDVKTIIQGFSMAYEELENAKLYIMGPSDEDESYSQECRALVESFGLNNVIFTGRVNVKNYIGKMDLLLLGSISEAQPLAVLEGMAARKPHILTDVGCCRELMHGVNDGYGDAGIIVPVMDYISMGKAIVKLYKDENLRKRMGENAYNRVSNLYTIETFIDGYKNIYQKVVKK